MPPKVVLNMAYCEPCDQVLASTSRHDFRQCVGGHGFVDGGHDYIRRGGNLVEMSVEIRDGKLKFVAGRPRFSDSGSSPVVSGSELLGG